MSFPNTPTSYSPEPPGHAPAWPAPVPAHARRRRAGMIAVAAAGVLVLMASTGLGVWLVARPDAATPEPAAAAPAAVGSFVVSGKLVLVRGQFVWQSVEDPSCEGLQGYTDLRAGTQVTVTDSNGKTLAVGTLDRGVAEGITTEEGGMHRATTCTLPFKVADVRRGVGPYGVEVAHRGAVSYTEDRLTAANGITLSLS